MQIQCVLISGCMVVIPSAWKRHGLRRIPAKYVADINPLKPTIWLHYLLTGQQAHFTGIFIFLLKLLYVFLEDSVDLRSRKSTIQYDISTKPQAFIGHALVTNKTHPLRKTLVSHIPLMKMYSWHITWWIMSFEWPFWDWEYSGVNVSIPWLLIPWVRQAISRHDVDFVR